MELGSATVSVASDVASGADLASENFVAALPYGLAPGTYFIGVELDIGNTVEEQGLRPDGSGVDGETNNLFFSNLPVLQVNGITLQVALDDGNSPIALGTFEDEPGSAAFWFGRDDAGDSIPEDNQTFEEAEGAQTPVINAGDYAAFTLDVATSSVVRFKWGILSGSDQNVLTVSVNGVVVDSISGDVSLDEIDPGILVPDNGTVEWRYTKGAATQGDFAVVDDVRVELNNQPDLVLSAINYTPGEYILDVAGIGGAPNQLLGTEYLDISVEATNQGEDVIATQFTSADLEVRLSTDRVYGNADDILLGTVSQVEGDLLSGSLIRFIGPIQLGDSIPENSYYLIAKVDSNDEVAEFSEENNIFITENRDVEIKRLPALRIYNPNPLALSESIDGINNYLDPRDAGVVEVAFDIDDELNYYAEGPMRLRFSVQNIGLDRIEASETWTVQFRLRGARRDDLSDAVDIQGIIDAFDPDIELGDFTVTEQMDGRSEAQPTGDILDFDVELALPSGARLNDIIDEELSISDYLWIVVVELDSTDAIEESEIIRESPTLVAPSGRPWWIISLSEALLANHSATNGDPGDGMFGISGQPFLIDGGDWELIYFGNPTITEEGFLAYAFNRNPADSDTAGGQFPGTYGVTTFEGDDVFSITFDALTRATDISYVVEAADTLPITPTATGYTVLATVDGPFDELTGSSSLTGDGGLIDEANVLGVLDQGYTARITVKDDQIVGATPSRFLQVRVSYDSLSAAWDPLAAGIADPNERGLFDDGDGDGESNIAEWLTGTIIDPFVPDGVTASDAELLVASYFANRGVVPFTPNRGPFDDFDSDGFSNLLEIAFGTDPILASSIPSLSVIEKYVADEMLLLNVIPGINGATQASLAPATDFDGDGESNLVELQLGTDPSVGGSFFGADEVDVLVAEGLAAVNAFNDTSTAADDGSFLPSGDFDTGGATNLAELAFGSDPNDAGADDGPLDTVGEVDTEVDSFIDANFTPGTYLAADDPDLDGFNNLEEIALGTNPLVSNP